MAYQTFDADSLALDPDSPFFWDHVARYWWVSGYGNGKRVLDVACGRGYGSYILAHVARDVVGIDLNRGSLEFARENFRRENLRFEERNVTALGGPDKFDLVTAFEVIEHVPTAETDAFLAGLEASLAPGGVLVVSTPNHDVVEKSGMPVPEFHINNFRPWELRETLSRRFPKVELLGQFRERSFLRQMLFNLDFFNLRHRLRGRGAPRATGDSAVAKELVPAADAFARARPHFERFPEEAKDYRFSDWHWRQAGLTVAVCSKPKTENQT